MKGSNITDKTASGPPRASSTQRAAFQSVALRWSVEEPVSGFTPGPFTGSMRPPHPGTDTVPVFKATPILAVKKNATSSHRAKHAGAISSGRQALYAQLNPPRETPADSWAEQQTQHLIEHLRQSALIHKDPVAQTPSRARLAGRGSERERRHEAEEETRSRSPIWRRGRRHVSAERGRPALNI